jgi:adenylosuccinate lyase
MIPRYSPPEFQALWSPKRKYEAWFDVEVAACRAMEGAGIVPAGTADQVSPFRAQLDAGAIDEIEKVTRHDVIAFLTHVEGLAGEPARWLHRGMTSSDVLDSSLALLLVEATDGLLVRLDAGLEALRERIEEHRRTPAIGRSHGIHAEPVTFGLILAGHYAELARGRKRLLVAREEIAVGKIAGAVGTYAHLTPAIEVEALASLGLRPETASTQVVARDRHAAYVATLGVIAAGIERFSTNVRHWQRTEVGEAEEHFKKGQKGSSAMPHKRNPVLTENLSGLGRVVRAAVVPGLENVALERVRGVVADLVVYPERLRQNLDQTGGLWASEGILLALVGQGLGRQDAYVLVQRNAMKAFEGEGEFRALLHEDAEIRRYLSAEEVDREFDLNHALAHVDTIIDRVLEGA